MSEAVVVVVVFFCDNASGTLYEASTFNMGATDWGDCWRCRTCFATLRSS